MKFKIIIIISSLAALAACNKVLDGKSPEELISDTIKATEFSHQFTDVIKPELAKVFNRYGYKGSFVMYETGRERYVYFNPDRCAKRFSPASTFKILNSLIGLETGVLKDDSTEFAWDGVKRDIPSWNRDHTLKSAFANSVVWYYRKLARMIGTKKMKMYIDSCSYGNRDISGGIDKFWLDGGLAISQEDQIDFLLKLYRNQLPFSKRSMDIVKKIMINEENDKYVIRGKTGASPMDNIGWYVGWVEKDGKAYIFALNIEAKNGMTKEFLSDRVKITKDILENLGVI